jgi:hypothetical protein
MKLLLTTALSLALFGSASLADPTVYLIRHGEKPADGDPGLSSVGSQRAQCLRSVFGASSQYNIGYILAQAYKSGKTFFHFPIMSSLAVLVCRIFRADQSD